MVFSPFFRLVRNELFAQFGTQYLFDEWIRAKRLYGFIQCPRQFEQAAIIELRP
jgi:hypothetical protein